MPRLLRCPQGHEWESLPGDHQDARGMAFCPVCGLTEQTQSSVDRPTSAGTAADTPAPGGEATPQLNAYEVLEEIGRGGMGIVYKARQRDRNRIVALKIIRKEKLANADNVARFRREARAAARLSHPNIVLLFEADQEGDIHYLAMEYVAGVTLQDIITRHGPLPVDVACDYLRQVALGLQHAHEQGMIHRDIKPANLLVQSAIKHSAATVKILDLGVARLHQLQHEEVITTLTQHGAVIGTADYIAPEQIEDPHTADVRADLYALGCTAYAMLTGQVPFEGGTLIQKLDRQRWETPPPVDQLRPKVPTAVAAVVSRLMAKDPADRFQTAAELARALEELANTGSIAALAKRAAMKPSARWRGHEGPVVALAFLADGKHFITGGRDRILRVWDATHRREVRRQEFPREVSAMAAAPAGANVVIGVGVGLRLLDALTGIERHRFAGHLDAIRSLAFSPDGKLAASASEDKTLRLWDVQAGRPRNRLVRHSDAVNAVAFSPDGKLLASAGRDQALIMWDAATGREEREFDTPRGAVTAAAFCTDGLHLLSAHFDTTLRLWDCESGREMRRLQGHRQMIRAAACSARGRLASGGNDRTLRVWDPDTGAELAWGEAHDDALTALAFSPDGSLLATAGADGTISLWDVAVL